MTRTVALIAFVALAGALVVGRPVAARKNDAAKLSPTPEAPLAPSVDGLPIGAIPKQTLPTGSCAAYLWTKGNSHALVAMIGANPAFIRYAPGGAMTDLPRAALIDEGRLGVPASSSYASGDLTVKADLTIVERPDIQGGAAIPEGTLSIGQAGGDVVVVPVAGLIGCG